jgi:predicted XRE-type DNA-binding protein
MSKKNPSRGSTFSSYLKEDGTYDDTTAVAVKRVLAFQLEQAMEKEHLSKNQMAKRMKTSRSQLDRILDPENPNIQLDTILKAASVLGRELRLELV